MTERWELVELIGQTLEERNIAASEQTVEAVLDSIEDLIRADERERNREADGVEAYLAVEKALIDLRVKVQKLHEAPYPHIHYGGEPTGWRVALNAVLILLDQYGGSDD